jgi:sensor histidine kinase YesM
MVMRIVAKGNFNIRIPNAHNDEVGQMAESFNVLIEKINFLINDVVKKETAYKDAQLTALQYQINPHFIYNTIDIFRMKLELEGNYEMADSITSFGKMLRYNINRDSQYATIKEEVDYIEKYLNLQKLRYGERIVFVADLPEDFKNIKIIRFMLQPIVENSIKHGIDNYKKGLYIQIKFIKRMRCVQVEVIDNGKGINDAELELLNKQLKNSKALEKKNDTYKNIGLENINARIKLFYGEQYYIKLESIEGEYTKAIINIPMLRIEGDDYI